MRIHHLNCGTLRPHLGRPGNGLRGWLTPAHLVTHCLLVESDDGLVLVDTGFGTADVDAPRERLGRFFLASVRPALERAETALEQVRRLGFDQAHLQHILLTHLDLDHAGGLPDFPAARVHVCAAELEAACAARAIAERVRYRPRQWAHGPCWVQHSFAAGESWHGLPCVRPLPGVSPELLLVALPGHTRGHCGVAVRTQTGGWLLHCGDGYVDRSEIEGTAPASPLLPLYQQIVQVTAERAASQARLRALAAEPGSDLRLFSSHDPREFAALELSAL
jgi:glyoxylase-like metal-dependent hydrolase (beta-lactamase superfamily II)